jgi:HD-GYP domain-containing protein (c-di-GMP phosphodiesterase class II)
VASCRASRAAGVPANVSRPGVAGLALLNNDVEPIAATAGLPPLDGALADFLRSAMAEGRRAIWPMHAGPTGQPVMGFLQPMLSGIGVSEGSERIGAMFGAKEVGDELFPLLRDRLTVVRTGRALLLRPEANGTVRVLSPVGDAFAPLEVTLSVELSDMAAIRAVLQPGGFGEGRGIGGEPVLYVSRPVEPAGWILLYTVSRDEALGSVAAAGTRRTVWLAAILGGLGLLLAAAWYLGASRRSVELAERLRESAHLIGRQRDLLESLANTQRSAISVIAADDSVAFANAASLGVGSLDQGEVRGKTARSLFGHARARALLRGVAEARAAGAPVMRLETMDAGETEIHATRVDFLPIDGEPGDSSVLVIESDVTDVAAEAARREGQQRELLRFLVGLLDERDPHAARQSENATRVALAIAADMDLAPADKSAIDLAGRLINLGKFFVPADLLRSESRFGDDDRARLRAGHVEAANMLAFVAVDTLVAQAFRDIHERWDGSGWPDGKRGDDISLAARVLAVANAAVAMASPRSYRAAMPRDAIVDELWTSAGKTFDRTVVASLVGLLERDGLALVAPDPEVRSL